MEYTIQHKENDNRGIFLMESEEGVISQLTYSINDKNTITIDHTETKRELEGQGLAAKLVAHTVDFARANNIKVIPLCPYAEIKFDQHPEYADVRA